MPVFDLSLYKNKSKRGKSTAKRYVIVVPKCEGIIRIGNDGIYKVEYNGKLYNITGESYISKGKKNIYARKLDKYSHRIKIIRDVDNRKSVDSRFYIPFSVGLIAKGKLVKVLLGSTLFHIVSCYNRSDMVETANAFKEWRKYEEKVANKEIDLDNELE